MRRRLRHARLLSGPEFGCTRVRNPVAHAIEKFDGARPNQADLDHHICIVAGISIGVSRRTLNRAGCDGARSPSGFVAKIKRSCEDSSGSPNSEMEAAEARGAIRSWIVGNVGV